MEKALFIETDVRFFGFLFLPEPEKRKPIGFVLIHPFAEERKSAHRTLVELSRELYHHGFPVLMFDLRGCGDSEGNFGTVRLIDWITDIDAAIYALRSYTQLPDIGIIGLRFGAFLSLCYASAKNDIPECIWIEPVLHPLEYLRKSLRHKLMKELCTDGMVMSNRNELLQNLLHNISIDFDGYEISSVFYKDLQHEHERQTIAEKLQNIKQGLVISVSMNGKMTKSVRELLTWKPDLKYDIVQMELFWNKIDEVDNQNLISKIKDYLISNYNQFESN